MKDDRKPSADLKALLTCLKNARRERPQLSISALMTLLYIAQETAERDLDRIPTVKKVVQELGVTVSGAARILEVLSEKGRPQGGKSGVGYGLVTTGSLANGRASNYFLTDMGKVVVKQILYDLTGQYPDRFNPLDESALLLLVVDRLSKK